VIKLKTAILTSFAISCLLATLFLVECEISVKASPDIIHVPDDYRKIQWAVGNASEGATILVHAGTYYGRIIVNKSLSLVGEDRDSTIIDGNETESVIVITANNVSVKGFMIRSSGSGEYNSGVFIDNSRGNHITSNVITKNRNAIYFQFSSNNVVLDNKIENNYAGISLYSSVNNLVLGNEISSNSYNGLSLYSSSNNVVLGNTIASNWYGIYLYFSSNNVVSGNTIASNWYGIYLYSSSNDNIIYHNNFINNVDHVWRARDSVNAWDHCYEGNYWSGYDGTDFYGGPYQNETGSDGIGDTPYFLDENQDSYPLMGIFSDFYVNLKTETYYITTVCNSTATEFRFEIGPETGNKIIYLNVTGKGNKDGFCRVMVPTELMEYPYIVLVDMREIVPTLLDVSNVTHIYLYLTYAHGSHTITIISSKTLRLYNELLEEYAELQLDLHNLNLAYHVLLSNYSLLLSSYDQLQDSYRDLNYSYQEHRMDYLKNKHTLQNLTYIFAATIAIFLITTVYLSKHAHTDKTKLFQNENRY
jgi:parallel beta-helix repeat protein